MFYRVYAKSESQLAERPSLNLNLSPIDHKLTVGTISCIAVYSMVIHSSRTAFNYLSNLLVADVEELWVIALRSDNAVIRSSCLFRGTVDSCQTHPRDIFRFACCNNASAIILAHNHPSQNPRPSRQDLLFTKQIIQASQILEIPVLDHIILTKNSYWSFADKSVFKK